MQESMLDRESLAKSLHFNYKEIDAHINSHFSDKFLLLKELVYPRLYT